ncbi:flavin-containing monooxygenase [Jatrophihabitans sp. YIM 134969]
MTHSSAEHVDVLVIGAGLSGVGAACHLREELPGKSFLLLEARDAIGGTWDLFRYPGVRSDSDMFTLGYDFRPWRSGKAIADGPSIRRYVRDTAAEYGVDRRIRFGHRVVRASWSGDDARWTVVADTADGERTYTCSFLFGCSGYYRYDEGYTPDFEGLDDFEGTVVHPQHWPEDLDWSGRKVVVIGSGATAVTLVPSMAADAEHVTMLQRTPTYISALPSKDALHAALSKVLPPKAVYAAIRAKNVAFMTLTYQLARRRPELMKKILRSGAVKALPAGFDVDTHLAPTYQPWDQRLCVVPDGDLFRAISSGRASIVTDRIVRFTATGIELASGQTLEADVVVTATGLNLLALGGVTFEVDGRPVDLADTVAYKGMMLSGVPNMALTIGYTNASWTLKADLVARYVCRLLAYMDEHDVDTAVPDASALIAASGGDTTALEPIIDLQSGYVLRSVQVLPKQGPSAPWRLHQNYVRDLRLMRRGPLTDAMLFSRSRDRARPTSSAAVPAGSA